MVGSVPIAAGFAPALGGVEIGLAAALLPLLVLSGFFSSSETALFGMTESERIGLRRRRPIAGGAADRLLAEPRMLLVTMLLGNTTINTLYFVTSSVLLVRLQGHLVLQASVAMGTLLGLVVLGEIVPKLAGETRR
ncbi:MAG: DUF21 domain-containing protein, partial [Planctomycetota bacterium]|nr:DUF21 domain-containing protein [Planctomycetota bacterium]